MVTFYNKVSFVRMNSFFNYHELTISFIDVHSQKEARAAGSRVRNPRRAIEAFARFTLM